MAYEEFFTNRDKPYSENLNDALCLVDAFDLSVPMSMPAGFSNGEFSSNIGITRKCGVGLVTLMSRDSGVTIGTDSISGSGELVFRIYPNFNSFYKWSKILLTKTGNVTVGFRRVDGTDISVTVDSDGNISDNTDLRELKEIDLVLTLSSATISQILVWFVNDQTVGRVRSSALLEASQLANVNGQVVAGEVKAVNGGTVKTALDSLHSTVTSEIEDLEDSITGETNAKLVLKEDKSNKVTVLDSNSSHYPSCTAVNAGLNLKEDKSNKVTTLDSNSSHYPSCTAVNTGLASKEDKSNKVTTLDNNSSHYPSCSAVKTVTDAKENTSNKVNSLDSNSFSNTLYPSTNALKLALDLIKDMVTCDITAEWQTIGSQNFNFKCIFDVNLINLKYEIKVKAGGSYILISSGTITSNQETVNTTIRGYGTSPECLVRIIFPYTLEEVKSQTFTI